MNPGTVLAQNIRLLRPLGVGGMGSIWLADHLTLRTQVAVKFMSDALVGDASARARFSDEAALSAQLKSRHIVQVFDRGIFEGRPYIVMELLEGESLEARLRREPRPTLEEIVAIVRQTAKGLAKAHDRRIVHRDIKPDNVFLTRDDDGALCAKILDFGVARSGDEIGLRKTATGSMMGTPLFMSPEQVANPRAIDHRTDLWALGVVAYQALTGKMPFDGETMGAVFVSIVQAKPLPPSSIRPDLAAFDAWMARALASEPDRRFQSAREMADAFAACAEDDSRGSLTPVSSQRSFDETSARSRFRLPVALIVGALAIIAIVGLALPSRETARAPANGIVQPAAPVESIPSIASPRASPSPSASGATAPPAAPTYAAPSAPASSKPIPVVSVESLKSGSQGAVAPSRKKKDRGF